MSNRLPYLALVCQLALALLLASWAPLHAAATYSPSQGSSTISFGQWKSIGPDGGDMHFVFITSRHTVIASHGFGGVWRSTNHGDWWEIVDDPDLVEVAFLSMDEASGVLFAGGTHGLWISHDDGRSWDRLVTGVAELDGSPSDYEVVSIIALNDTHILASVKINPAATHSGKPVQPFEGVFELIQDSSGTWTAVPHDPPFRSKRKAVVMLAYDEDFQGSPALFVSSSAHGLFIVRNLTGSWDWAPVLINHTTRVSVDEANDIVYVGTLGEWFWRCVPSGSSWSTSQIVPEGETDCAIACFIKPDPYNPDRLWWGTVAGDRGSPYEPPAGSSGRSLRGVGVWDPDNERWLICNKSQGWGNIIAIDHHQPGENPDDYRNLTDYGYAAKYAFVPGGGEQCIFKTEDGGLTWFRSYDGLYADTMNEVTYLDQGTLAGSLVAICVSGIQISTDLGDSWLPDVDFQIYGVSQTQRAGYAWDAASPITGSLPGGGKVDIYVATGYPPTDFTGNGLYAVSFQGGDVSYKRLTRRPIHDIVQVGSALVLGLESGGVRIYHMDTGDVDVVDGGFPADPPGVFTLAHRTARLADWWFASTYEGTIPRDSDNYFYDGPGSLYRARDLLTQGSSTTWELVYHGSDHRVVALSLSSSGQLLALLSNGKLLLTSDFTAPTISWSTVDLPLGSSVRLVTDMEVDWDNKLIFISTFGRGVLLVNLTSSPTSPTTVKVKIQELNDGLMTRYVRNLLLVKNGSACYLFAGTQGHSVWRLRYTTTHKPPPGPRPHQPHQPQPPSGPTVPTNIVAVGAVAAAISGVAAWALLRRRS